MPDPWTPSPTATSPRWRGLAVAAGVGVAVLVFTGLVAVNVLGYTDGHFQSSTQITAMKIREALMIYAAKNHGAWPPTLAEIAKYCPEGRVPTDAWGRPFLYAVVDGQPRLVSWGADGEPGGEGLDADLYSDRELP